MKLDFRKLTKDEIDVRIGTQKLENPQDKNSRVIAASYLLYKDARVDMRLLDEVVGAMNWQRTHSFKDGKLYCTVSIWDDEKNMWISKEDVGVESNTEAEKGQASDAFKRACFNFGIGRELYTAPFIWIEAKDKENLKYTKMIVKHIGYDENGKITELIIEDNKGNVRFEKYDREKKADKEPKSKKEPKITQDDVNIPEEGSQVYTRASLIAESRKYNIDLDKLAIYYKHNQVNEITNEELFDAIEMKKKRGIK